MALQLTGQSHSTATRPGHDSMTPIFENTYPNDVLFLFWIQSCTCARYRQTCNYVTQVHKEKQVNYSLRKIYFNSLNEARRAIKNLICSIISGPETHRNEFKSLLSNEFKHTKLIISMPEKQTLQTLWTPSCRDRTWRNDRISAVFINIICIIS